MKEILHDDTGYFAQSSQDSAKIDIVHKLVSKIVN